MNILLLTDFSELSEYARFMADKCSSTLEANLHVLKIIDIPSEIELNNEGEPLSGMAGDVQHLLEDRDQALSTMSSWISDLKSNVQSAVIFGHFQKSAKDYIDKHEIDLVVMGTHGVSGIKEFLSGSMTESLIKNNRVSVLSLKCDRSDVAFEHLLITGDFEGVFDFEVIQKIQKVFNSKIHLLSVIKDVDREESILIKMENFIIDNHLDNTLCHTVISDDEEQGIEKFMNKYVVDNQISFELLAVEKKDKSALGYLFTGCQATSIVNHVWRPILTYLKK